MELVSFAKDVVRTAAEQIASYRIGQAALRHVDRALWVVEKCARWAVPPPLDLDDTPQPELVRPLPWVFFLTMLVVLRVARESISLVNLIRGMPPLRSADVVTYIQSKRRYLRTLKYQGNRNLRARNAPQSEPWYRGLQALFEFTLCFRPSHNYGNNNTTRVSNNDEVLVVKRNKRTRESTGTSTVASTNETTMERLIEKMMVQLDADSDDDSSFTLNTTSMRSDQSEDSDPEDRSLENHERTADSENIKSENTTSPVKTDSASSTPKKYPESKKPGENEEEANTEQKQIVQKENTESKNIKKPGENEKEASTEQNKIVQKENDVKKTGEEEKEPEIKKKEVVKKENSVEKPEEKEAEAEKKEILPKENGINKENILIGKTALSEQNKFLDVSSPEDTKKIDPQVNEKKKLKNSPKETTKKFLQSERCSPQKQPSKQTKFGTKVANAFSKTFSFKKHEKSDTLANGRAMSVPNKKKGLVNQNRDNDTPVLRISHSDDSL